MPKRATMWSLMAQLEHIKGLITLRTKNFVRMASQCYYLRAMIKIVLPLLALTNSSLCSTYPTGYDKICSNHLTCIVTKWPTMILSPRQTLTISHLIDCLRHLTAKSLTFLSGYIQSSNSRAVS